MWEGVKVTRVLTWLSSRDEEGLQWGGRALGGRWFLAPASSSIWLSSSSQEAVLLA